MIHLTKFNGDLFILNSDLIKTIESNPDTIISLNQGEKIMVKESVEIILNLIINYKKKIIQEPIVF